jgi:hypothetical protein
MLAGGQEQAGAMSTTMYQLSAAVVASEIESGSSATTLIKASAILSGLQTQSGTLAAALQKAVATLAGEDVADTQFPYTLPFPLAIPSFGLFAKIGKVSSVFAGTVTSIPAYDANSTPLTGSTMPGSFNFAAAAGADVFVAITADRSGGVITGATYGGNAMTQVATVNHNNAAGSGTTNLYRAAAAGTGAALAVAPQGSGSAWFIVEAISISGVNTVGTPVTATGSGTALSQTISGWGLQLFSAGNGGGSAGNIASVAGETNYSNTSAGSSVAQAVSIATSAGTATATLSASTPWGSIFVPIN